MTNRTYTHRLDELNKRNEEDLRKLMANITATDWSKIVKEATDDVMKQEAKKRAIGYGAIGTIAAIGTAAYWFFKQ